MQNITRLKDQIETLNESIRLHWLDLATKSLSAEDRLSTRRAITLLIDMLRELVARLDEAKSSATDEKDAL